MTVKQFFKSNAFRSLVVLMTIVIVCGAVIAVASGIFNVSDEEAAARAVSKIFGGTPDSAQQLVITEKQSSNGYGAVNQAYVIVFDGQTSLLVKATGSNGYRGGTITAWTSISTDGCSYSGENVLISAAVTGIRKVQYESNDRQTKMSDFGESFYAQFTQHNDDVSAGKYFTSLPGGAGALIPPVADTTASSAAIINAVNAALCFAYGGNGL